MAQGRKNNFFVEAREEEEEETCRLAKSARAALRNGFFFFTFVMFGCSGDGPAKDGDGNRVAHAANLSPPGSISGGGRSESSLALCPPPRKVAREKWVGVAVAALVGWKVRSTLVLWKNCWPFSSLYKLFTTSCLL